MARPLPVRKPARWLAAASLVGAVFSGLALSFTACAGAPPIATADPASSVAPSSSPPTPRDDHAVSFVLDRSGSMTGTKLQAAKEGIGLAIAGLASADKAEVIAFDSVPMRIVSMRPVVQLDEFKAAIAKLAAGGGTDFLPALQMAFADQARAHAKIHHVVFASDGQAPAAEVLDLVDQAAAQGVTVSTIALGADTDRKLLASIAEHGHGRAYVVEDLSDLSRVLTKEVEIVIGATE